MKGEDGGQDFSQNLLLWIGLALSPASNQVASTAATAVTLQRLSSSSAHNEPPFAVFPRIAILNTPRNPLLDAPAREARRDSVHDHPDARDAVAGQFAAWTVAHWPCSLQPPHALKASMRTESDISETVS